MLGIRLFVANQCSYEVEGRINDSISFSYFCGMTIEKASPDIFCIW